MSVCTIVPKAPNVAEELFAFQCASARLPAIVPQFLFAAPLNRRFLADFAFPAYKVLVEINGGIWRPGGGAHSRPANIERDIEKAQYAALLGYLVLPFTPREVRKGRALTWTERTLKARGWTP